ncbi:MAG TPA: hypothetical protein VGR98_28035 [Streptosporangiaceae bacterium]|nr:hypothetical protein [Streptosporangiaceae bacterium]
MAAVPVTVIHGDSVTQVLVPCQGRAEVLATGSCECGHPKEGWLCALHAATIPDACCERCLRSGRPHECPVTLAVTRQPELN